MISKVMIIGSGQMGSGIAQVFAQAGFTVYLNDIKEEFVQRGLNNITKQLERSVEKGRMSADEKDQVLANLLPSVSYEDAKQVQLVIEAATENREIKLNIFKQLDELTDPKTILASNTSSLSTKHQERVIGMHFFNPAPIMKLVEVIKALQTSEEVVQAVRELTVKIGKTPVDVKDSYGFVVNRILIPMINEAVYILGEGVASAEEIDEAMKLGANHPIGPLALADLIGLDVCLAIMGVLNQGFGDQKYRPAPLFKKMVEAGKLGRKTKEGFFTY